MLILNIFSFLTFIGLAGLYDLLFFQKWGENDTVLTAYIISSVILFSITFFTFKEKERNVFLYLMSFSYLIFAFFLPKLFLYGSIVLFCLFAVNTYLFFREIKGLKLESKYIFTVIFLILTILSIPKEERIKITFKKNLPVKKLAVDLTCIHCKHTLKNYLDAKTYNLELLLVSRDKKSLKANIYLLCAKDKEKALENILIYQKIDNLHCLDEEKLKTNTILAVLNGIKKLPSEVK